MRVFADKLGKLSVQDDLEKVNATSRLKFRAWDDLVVQPPDSPNYPVPEGLVSRVSVSWLYLGNFFGRCSRQEWL